MRHQVPARGLTTLVLIGVTSCASATSGPSLGPGGAGAPDGEGEADGAGELAQGPGPTPEPEQEQAPPPTRRRPGHEAAYAPDAPAAARGERIRPHGAPRPGDRCVEAHNPQGTPSTNCGGTNLAWQYIPSVNFRLEQVDMYTGAADFILLGDAGGRPGQPLARVSFRRGQDAGWVSAMLDQPVDLQAGRTYWLWHSGGACSIVESGVSPVYWTNFRGLAADSWEGPWRSHAFLARMYGTCL